MKHAYGHADDFKAKYEKMMRDEIEALLKTYPAENQRIFKLIYPNGPTVAQMPLAFGQIMATEK